jgi:hypothetical protein
MCDYVGRTFEIKDKRGLNIESFSFILQDVDFIQGKNGASAIVKGYIKGIDSNIAKIDALNKKGEQVSPYCYK